MRKKGFTLIELLIVIGIMVILLGAVVVAINPGRQFAQTRNAARWTHVNAILNAVYSNMADNNGAWTCGAALPSVPTPMGSGVGDYNICSCLVPIYVAQMPVDPSTGSWGGVCTAAYSTGYNISQDTTTYRVTVSATGEAPAGTISMTR